MWNAYLFDTMTGLIRQHIDIPSFAWSMSVADSSFTTTSKTTGDDDITGLELPWTAIPGSTPTERAASIQPYKRGILLCWLTGKEDQQSMGTPILAGALGVRTSSRQDVSIPYLSIPSLLADRILVHEKGFGTGKNHTSPGTWEWENLSWRALACAVVQACTSGKPGGQLPIDLPYLDEPGTHGLPAEDDTDTTGKTSHTKSKRRTTLPDGYIETIIDGDKTTVTETHTNEQTTKKNTTETYTYTSSKGKKTTKTRNTTKTITTGKTTTTKTTVTQNKKDYATITTTTKTTTYTYDQNGKQTGSTTTTQGPTTTYTTRQTTTTYHDYNTSNHTCRQILNTITTTDSGPDIQFRPYLTTDQTHIRFRLEAGSDGDIHLHQNTRLSLDTGPHGTLDNITIDHAAPTMRIYATGAGTDTGTICALAEDLTLTGRLTDPWPLRETTLAMTDAKTWEPLAAAAKARLDASRRPLAQLTGILHADDTDQAGNPLHPLGSFWPGEMFDISITGMPDWPDGIYPMRLMEMSGDQTDQVKLKFDPVIDPVE